MTSIPPVRVEFTGSSDPLVREFQKLNAAAQTTDKGLNTMNAGMREASRQADKFQQGLAALKAQQVAATSTTQTHTSALKNQTASVGNLVAGLRALAGGYIGIKVLGFLNDTIAASAALHDLAQKTGATTEALSVLQFVGKRNEVDAGDLAIAFKALSLALGQLRDGGKDAVEAFARIGLNAKALEGLSVDQAFSRIAHAVAGLPDGFDKAEASTKLFGRSGAALIPLLNEIAEKGLPALTREAQTAGAVISEEAAASADQFRDSLDSLKSSAAGAARTILNPLLPSLTTLTQVMSELFSRKPGDFLRHDLEDITHLLDILTFKAFNLRARLAGPQSPSVLSPSQIRDEPFETKPIKIAKAHKDIAAAIHRENLFYNEQIQLLEQILERSRELADKAMSDRLNRLVKNQIGTVTGPDNTLSLSEQVNQDMRQREADTLAYVRFLQDESQATELAFQNIGQSLRESVAGELANFFTDGIQQAKSFGDAVRSLALIVVRSIQQIVAQLIAARIVQGIASAIFGGGIPKAPTDAIAFGPVMGAPKFHSGGLIGGSGEVPIIAQSGEMVINRLATARHFAELQAINAQPFTLQRYARGHYHGGGMVTPTNAANGSFAGHISLDRGLVMEIVNSNFPVLVQNHRKTIKGSIG